LVSIRHSNFAPFGFDLNSKKTLARPSESTMRLSGLRVIFVSGAFSLGASTPVIRATLFAVSSVTQRVLFGPVAIRRGPAPALSPASVVSSPSVVRRTRSPAAKRGIQ
jgi:hypothetical protein